MSKKINIPAMESQGFRVFEQDVVSRQKLLLDAYKTALEDIKKELAYVYQTYGTSGKLTYATLTRINQLEGLLRSVEQIYTSLGGQIKLYSTTAARQAYVDGFYVNAWIADTQVGYTFAPGVINPKVVEASVNNEYSGADLITTLDKNFNLSIFNIRRTITNGLIRGVSYSKMAGEVKKFFDGNFYNSLRVIRTETHRAYVLGSHEIYQDVQEMGIKGREMWVSAKDNRTRPDHIKMNNVKADKKGIFTLPDGVRTVGPGLTGYAHHDINCRCRKVFIIDQPSENIDVKSFNEWLKFRNIDKNLN